MSAIQNKGHVTIDGYLFMLARLPRVEKHVYGREEAPTFVNKFSSGDPNYRDATFYPHFVQNNYLNGFDQEKFNDGGKFYRSSGVDTTQQEKLTLEKRWFSTGQARAGVKITAQANWRAAASSVFGNGSDGDLTISVDTTDAPTDSAFTGTAGATTGVGTNTAFVAGQEVLIIQMKGTGAGNKMRNKITSYSAGSIGLRDPLNADYISGAQIIVGKQYGNVTVQSAKTWTAKQWDGTVGGILFFVYTGTLTVTGAITAAGKGFVGGTGGNSGSSDTDVRSLQGDSSTGAGGYSSSANGSGGGGSSGSGSDGGNGGGGAGYGVAGSAGGAGQGTPGAGGAAQGVANLSTIFMGAGGGGGRGEKNGSGTGGAGGRGGGIIAPFGKTLTISGSISVNGATGSNASVTSSDGAGGGGGGAGGSVWLQYQSGTLGTNLVTSTGGAGGAKGDATAGDGGAGGAGRIHADYLTSTAGTTNPTLDTTIDTTLADTPAGSSATYMIATDDGSIFSWDGASTYTELFNVRRFEWFDTGTDTTFNVGDVGGTETAQAQSFQVAIGQKLKAIQVNLKKNAGTPGDITVRIETNNAGVPSGTLVDATNATATIPAFVTTTAGWITVEFPASFALSASTTYWIVLKTAAAANDNNYAWTGKSTSGYANGNMANSTDGGSTWAAQAGKDAYFRLLGNTTSVNCMKVSSLTGTRKIYIGTGTAFSTNNGDAKLYAYDGSAFALLKVFQTTDEASVLSMAEFGSTTTKMYFGLGATAKVYVTSDFSTYTLSKTFNQPDNPGYVFALKEYNGRLYAAGGYPQLLAGNNTQYDGFMYSWDEFNWNKIGEFDHTVILSLEVFDNLLFIGTIKKRLYVYNTASIDKLLDLPWNVQVSDMSKWDDKLSIALAPTPGFSASGFESVYLFDRSGFHNAFSISGKSWYSLGVFNNNLMGGNDDGTVYQSDFNNYQASGTMQLSYFEASLPNIDKKWRTLTLIHDALPTGCTILAEYKTDESDGSWTTIGTVSTVGALTTSFNFADNFYSKKITLRFTFATSVASSTPTLRVVDMKYVLIPDFKYMWKMKLMCADHIIWLDGTEPISLTTTGAIAPSDTTLNLVDGSGFPTKHKGVIIDSSGAETEIVWTGRSTNQLTGVSGLPTLASGQYTVKMTARVMHKTILAIKQIKTLYAYVDIDTLSYTVLFYNYQADDFVVNQSDGIENNVPVTLLEA